MASVLDIVFATMLVAGSHEMGHQTKADSLNESIHFKGTEWKTTAKGNNLSSIAGAGFQVQDMVAGMRGDKKQRLINALHKMSYIAKDRGDLKSIEKGQGKKARQVAQGALAMSAISDLMIAFGKTKGNIGLKFGQTSKGTPMLQLGGSF